MATWKRILTEGDVGPGSLTDTSLATHNQFLTSNRRIVAEKSRVLEILGDADEGDAFNSPKIAKFSAVGGDNGSIAEFFGETVISPYKSGGNSFDQGFLKFLENPTQGTQGVSVFAPYALSADESFSLPPVPDNLNKGHFLTLEEVSGFDWDHEWKWKRTEDLTEVGGGSQAGVVVGEADADKFLMLVHDVDANELKKMDIQELYAAITVSLFQALVDAGFGSNELYTGTGGASGDINNDGVVSTADLLEFLTQYGLAETASPTIVELTTCPLTDHEGDGFGVLKKLDIGTGDAAVTTGDFNVNVNVGQDHFTITEGLNNSLTQYPNKTIFVEPADGFETSAITISLAGLVQETVHLYVRIEGFTSGGSQINSATEDYLLASINPVTIPGPQTYPIPITEIPGNISGINGTGGSAVASLRISFHAQSSSGFVVGVGIEGIKFKLAVS